MSNDFDGNAVVATCNNDNCQGTTGSPEMIDEAATERFWGAIDRARIKENPAWLDELRSAGLVEPQLHMN